MKTGRVLCPGDPIAAIDIGTNTALLLVAQLQKGSQPEPELVAIAQDAEVTRLGRGIGHGGTLSPENIRRTLQALERFASTAAHHNAPVFAVGTEALRRAPNAGAFLDPAAHILGHPIEVIDGQREAELSFEAARRSFPEPAQGTLIVVDIGGGSTEIVISTAGRIDYTQSLPLGSVRLTEAFIRSDPPERVEIERLERAIHAALDAVPFPTAEALSQPLTLVGTAGTVTSLATLSLKMNTYDADRVHGTVLNAQELDRLVAKLAHSTQETRETLVGLQPKRADVIFAGATLLSAIRARSGAPSVTVSDRGVRWGLLHQVCADLKARSSQLNP